MSVQIGNHKQPRLIRQMNALHNRPKQIKNLFPMNTPIIPQSILHINRSIKLLHPLYNVL